LVEANSSNCFSLIDSYILFDAPLSFLLAFRLSALKRLLAKRLYRDADCFLLGHSFEMFQRQGQLDE
jgi:hypothetical protein